MGSSKKTLLGLRKPGLTGLSICCVQKMLLYKRDFFLICITIAS